MNDIVNGSVASPNLKAEKKIPVMEIFGPTIQGEGAVIGQQTYFIRFGLCDYKCTMCDSMYAVDPKSVSENAHWLTQDLIFEAFRAKWIPGSTRWITFSGGNPCIHNLQVLVNHLNRVQFNVHVETQGTKCPDWLQSVSFVTISPKGPGMGEKLELDILDAFVRRMIELKGSPYSMCFKIVVFDQRDLEAAAMVFERYQSVVHPGQWYLSLGNKMPPGWAETDLPHSQMMKILVADYLTLWEDIRTHPILSQAKFLPQWHVFLWGNQKGV